MQSSLARFCRDILKALQVFNHHGGYPPHQRHMARSGDFGRQGQNMHARAVFGRAQGGAARIGKVHNHVGRLYRPRGHAGGYGNGRFGVFTGDFVAAH